MELLKQLVQVCRQHYEKMLLTLALLGLGAAVWFLTQAQRREAQKIEDVQTNLTPRVTKAFVAVDLSRYLAALQAAEKPVDLELGLPHHLLNPVKWQRKRDGQLIKIETQETVGPAQLKVVKVSPLHYRVTLERIASPGSFVVLISDDSVVDPKQRRVRRYVTAENRRNESFVLIEVKGSEENPELVLELAATQEKITISKEQPYDRVASYTVDLKYSLTDACSPTGA